MRLGNIKEKKNYEGIKNSFLHKATQYNVMLMCLKEGEYLKPHISTSDAFLLVQDGEIIFTLEGKDFNLCKGDMFAFRAHETHSVKALSNTSFLLVK